MDARLMEWAVAGEVTRGAIWRQIYMDLSRHVGDWPSNLVRLTA
jgi:hypothetical protein